MIDDENGYGDDGADYDEFSSYWAGAEHEDELDLADLLDFDDRRGKAYMVLEEQLWCLDPATS